MIKDVKKERIQKVIANYGKYSRRETEALINQKKIKINGQFAKLGDKVSLLDAITINDEPVTLVFEKQYFLLNKPKGYICSRLDRKYGKTALSLIPNHQNLNLFTIGRLDVQTHGLLIITNDGALSNYVLRPDSQLTKTYLVTIDRLLTSRQFQLLKHGITLPNGYRTKKLQKLSLIENEKKQQKGLFTYKMVLIEGKNNQIRRMYDVLGIKIYDLKRIAIGKLNLKLLKKIQYIQIEKDDIYAKLNFKKEY